MKQLCINAANKRKTQLRLRPFTIVNSLFSRSIAIAVLALCIGCASAQDIHLSQFFEAPLHRNPALAGIVNGDYRIQSVYRSQWNSITDAYKTTSLNAEYKLPIRGNDYLTLATQIFHDQAGSTSLTSTHLLPAVNYHKALSTDKSMYLSLGFMGGYVQRRIDRSKITTNSTYDNGSDGEDALIPKYGYWDGSAGISFNSQLGERAENNLLLGAALHHFLRPKNSFYGNASVIVFPKWVFTADFRFGLGERSLVTMHNDYSTQGSYSENLSGIIYTYKLGAYTEEPDLTVGAGGFLRWGDAFIPTLQLNYKPFALSMSYDVNVSKLSQTTYGQGGYEISLTHTGFLNRDNSSLNAVLCPKF